MVVAEAVAMTRIGMIMHVHVHGHGHGHGHGHRHGRVAEGDRKLVSKTMGAKSAWWPRSAKSDSAAHGRPKSATTKALKAWVKRLRWHGR